jgi:hypothetical protein
MKNKFPYPLPLDALLEFRHPLDWHGLHRPMMHAGEVIAANGYVAVRATRGYWLDSDFPPATAEYLGRIGKLPWGRFPLMDADWREVDGQRGKIFKTARISPWLRDKPAPSPVWLVGGLTRVRLSWLQLVAMLPRCEIYAGPANRDDGMFFRFSGGIGMIARDPRFDATPHDGQLFPPATDMWTGQPIPQRGRPKTRN